MKENNDISLAGTAALVYWPEQGTKNIPQHLFGIHLVLTYLMTNFSTPLPRCKHKYASSVTPFCLCDFIDLILSSTILTLLICHSFLTLFYLRICRIDGLFSDTQYFLASGLVYSSLRRVWLWPCTYDSLTTVRSADNAIFYCTIVLLYACVFRNEIRTNFQRRLSGLIPAHTLLKTPKSDYWYAFSQ